MNIINKLLRLCQVNKKKVYSNDNYETFYYLDKEIIKLDLTKLDNIGTSDELRSIKELKSINNNLNDDQLNELQQLWFMYISMELFMKKYKSKKIKISDLILRLIKFKIVYTNYLKKLKETSSNYAMEVAGSGLDVLNVGCLFIYIDNCVSKEVLDLVKNTYFYYISELLDKKIILQI